MNDPSRRPRVVVVGGGFAGLAVTRRLIAADCAAVQLVDRHNYFVFKPLLAEVATGAVNATTAVVPLRRYVTSGRPIRAELVGLDKDNQQLHLRYGPDDDEAEVLDYDILVLALGSETNYFGIDGVEANALTMNNVGDAIALRHRVLDSLERAEVEQDPAQRRELQTFVIGGGSFTGVEVAGALTDYLRHAVAAYPGLRASDMRVILIEMADGLLSGLPDRVGSIAADELRRRGVDVRLGVAFAALDGTRLRLSDDSEIDAATVLWAGGVRPVSLAGDLPVATDDSGRIITDGTMLVQGEQNVYACGDVAAIPDGHGGSYPATAQHGEREGRHLARVLTARIKGEPAVGPFRYDSAGMLVALGERRATGDLRGHAISGLPAWLAWRGYYLSQMPTLGHKLRVAVDWVFDGFSGPTLVELPVRT